MSQDLYFYRQRILSVDICQDFTHEQIDSCLKALLKEHKLEEDEALRNKLFEEVEINSISISAYNKEIEKFLTEEDLYLSPQSRLFMVNNKILSAIHGIVKSKQKEMEQSNKIEKSNKLSTDYSTLEDLFNKKQLFINLQ